MLKDKFLNDAIHSGISSQEKGRSALFIGDVLNDAEAFRAADASLAVEGGSTASTGSARPCLSTERI
jgi:cation transport ATPase